MKESLQHIVQLVVLCIPLFLIPVILRSSNSLLNKIAGATDRIQKGVGLDKGLGKARDSMKDTAKKRAAFAGANFNDRLRNSDRLGGVPAGVANWGRNRRLSSAARKKLREEALASRKHEREGEVEHRVGELAGGNSRLAGAAQRIGGERLESVVLSQQRNRVAEELKQEQLRLEAEVRPGPNSGAELRTLLDQALNDGNEVRIRAVINKIATEGGKGDVARMGDVIEQAAQRGLNQEAQEATTRAIQDNWGTVKGNDPTLANLDLQTGTQRGGAPAVAPEQLSTMAPVRLEQLARQGVISHELIGTAAASGALNKMATDQRAQLEAGLAARHAATGGPGPAPTIDSIRIEHEAAAVRAGNTPPPPSDSRLKKDIVRLGSFKGVPLYRFKYRWSEVEYVGTMAQDILNSHPKAVSVDSYGFYRVDYGQLGFKMTTYKEWKK